MNTTLDDLAPQAREQLDRIERARNITAGLVPAEPAAPTPGIRASTPSITPGLIRADDVRPVNVTRHLCPICRDTTRSDR